MNDSTLMEYTLHVNIGNENQANGTENIYFMACMRMVCMPHSRHLLCNERDGLQSCSDPCLILTDMNYIVITCQDFFSFFECKY